jgi:hypothetical protein
MMRNNKTRKKGVRIMAKVVKNPERLDRPGSSFPRLLRSRRIS